LLRGAFRQQGFRFAWNCTQVLVGASLSVGGIDVPGVALSRAGPAVLSGGTSGPEASIGAAVSTALVLALLFVFFRRHGIHDLPLHVGTKSGLHSGRSA
jgi:hypothetical protein